MGIVDEDIVAVRDATDIVAVITQYTQLKRVGRRWVGLCPFHAEKTPSFYVNQETGSTTASVPASGAATPSRFVREIEHLDFVGAVEWLAGQAGITLRYTDQVEGEGRKRRAALVDAVEKAVDWYHERLLSVAGRRARPRATCATGARRRRRCGAYRIGWAPDAWDELAKALRLPDDVLTGHRARVPEQAAAARPTRSAVASCSRSSTPTATRSASAGG